MLPHRLSSAPGASHTELSRPGYDSMMLHDQAFGDVALLVDGRAFVRCRFARSTLVLAGVDTSDYTDCEFHHCSIRFAGPAAEVLRQLAAFARGDRQTRSHLDALFETLRRGADHRAPARVLSWAHLRSVAADVVLSFLAGMYAFDSRVGAASVDPVFGEDPTVVS